MSNRNEYAYADLEPSLVDEIRRLEDRITEQRGERVTLIAYALADSSTSESCREEPND